MYKKGDLVKDDLGIYLVLSVKGDLDSEIYVLKLLAFLSDQNLPNNILEMCQQITQRKEEELSPFSGKTPKFQCGDYVRYQGSWKHLSRIFFAVYKNHAYIYFVQQEAQSNLYDGLKEWVEEKYLRV